MGRITVADDVVSGQGHAFRDPAGNVVYASGNPCFLVRAMPGPDGDEDLDALGAALTAAAGRFALVTYRGEELGAPDDDRYTPTAVVGPVVADDGLLLWADTHSELPTAMLATMVEILVEELEDAGAHALVGPGPLRSVLNPFVLPDWTPAARPLPSPDRAQLDTMQYRCGEEADVDPDVISPARPRAMWMPGCSSCLRMKEFLERNGVDFEAVNVIENPEARAELSEFGMSAPVLLHRGEAVPGMDLVGIAKLVGFDYAPPPMLSPGTLVERYARVSEVVTSVLGQLTDDHLRYASPDRDRPLSDLVGHIASIMRAFLDSYDTGVYRREMYNPPRPLETCAELLALTAQTQAMVDDWWRRFGWDDDMQAMISTHWGTWTVHEVLERSVWHPAQHTRQLVYFVETRLGMTPADRLLAADLEGLPLPEGIHSGGEQDG